MRLALLGAMALATPAAAQTLQHCAPRDAVLMRLHGKYSEARQGYGLAANGSVMEVYASANGSWTIVITLASGITCILASGQHFEAVAEIMPKGDPT